MFGASLYLCNNIDAWGELLSGGYQNGMVIMKPIGILTLAACAILISGAAWSQETADVADAERFSLNKVDGGFVKIDRRLGTVSLCAINKGNMICRMAADERDAYDDTMDQMRSDMEALDARLAKLEGMATTEPEEDKKAEEPEVELGAGSEEKTQLPAEFDTAMEIAQEAMRRFFAVIQDLKKEYEQKATKPNT